MKARREGSTRSSKKGRQKSAGPNHAYTCRRTCSVSDRLRESPHGAAGHPASPSPSAPVARLWQAQVPSLPGVRHFTSHKLVCLLDGGVLLRQRQLSHLLIAPSGMRAMTVTFTLDAILVTMGVLHSSAR